MEILNENQILRHSQYTFINLDQYFYLALQVQISNYLM